MQILDLNDPQKKIPALKIFRPKKCLFRCKEYHPPQFEHCLKYMFLFIGISKEDRVISN